MKTQFKKLNKIVIITILLTVSQVGKAQYDAMFTQYMFNEMFINPAYAGSKEAMSATMLHRQQWVKFSGRPVTTSFSLHGPVQGNKMGAGLSVLNDRLGVLNRNLVYASYAYRLKVSQKGTLAMGLMGGFDSQVNKFADVKTNDDGSKDPQLGQNSVNILAPNFGTGLYYNTKTFYAGLSIPRIIDNQVRFSSGGGSYKIASVNLNKMTYYLTAGNLFTLNEDLKLRANAMIKIVTNAPIQFDLGANLLIKEMLWAGLSYRSNSAASIILGIQLNKQFLVSYSFDYGLNAIQKYSQGSHEIALSYLFSFKGKKVVTPRYF
jgi:type IX secretion system PorP/SprF family membrane protein